MKTSAHDTKYFLAVTEEGSVSGAAKALGLSQPALSMALRRLRETYDDPLVRLSPGVVELTPIGRLLRDHVRLVTQEEEKLQEQVRHMRNDRRGFVKFGIASYPLEVIGSEAFLQWFDDHPSFRAKVNVSGWRQLQGMLEAGELDFYVAVYEPSLLPATFEAEPLHKHSVVPFVAPDHPLLKQEVITAPDLAHYPVACIPSLSAYRSPITDTIGRTIGGGLPAEVSAFMCTDVVTLKSLVKSTDWIGYLGRNCVRRELDDGSLKELDFKLKWPKVPVAVIRPKNRELSDPAEVMIDIIRTRFED